MDRSPVLDEVLSAARRHAAAGAWDDVRQLLDMRQDAALHHPEIATLRAEAALRTGHPREARQWLAVALPVIEQSGDRAALRKAVNQLGVADIELGALDDAERVFGRALELARIDQDDLLVAHATNNMGAIANIKGQRDEALTLYQLAIPAYQRLGHVAGLAQSHHNMAISFRHLGQLERADDHGRRAIAYATECANAPLLALARLERAEVSLQSGDAALAEVGAKRAAAEFETIPDPIRHGDALRLVGAARLVLGRYVEAGEALDRALALARRHGSRLVEGEVLRVRAALCAATGRRQDAWELVAEAIGIFDHLGALAERDEARTWATTTLVERSA